MDGPNRVELSGATTRNWVCKIANLLVDGYDSPASVGILLPLHWLTPCLLLGAVAAGARVVVAAEAAELTGCDLAFTTADTATAALDAGVDEVLACSMTPFATRLADLPPMVLDAAAEIPSYGDHFLGRPGPPELVVIGSPYVVPAWDLGPTDRVLTALDPRSAVGLSALLAPLRAGAAVVLLLSGDQDAVVAQEQVTAIAGAEGLRRL